MTREEFLDLLARLRRASVGNVRRRTSRCYCETGFFTGLRLSGVLVRERFSEVNPGEVTGYAVTLPGTTGQDGMPRWFGGGRLHGTLTRPRLRNA